MSNFRVPVKGFTYMRDYAAITVNIDDSVQKVIIGSKTDFPMTEMFQLKQAESVELEEREPKEVNGVKYRNFRLLSINF